MQPMDREGIFKARPVAWKVKTFKDSQSVAIAIDFAVVGWLDQGQWVDWTEYQVGVSGDWFVIKKDGTVNTDSVGQLSAAMGWVPSFKAVGEGPPPERVVQVTVKKDTYKDRVTFKATWMNPENFVPSSSGADAETVAGLEARFGSLLRAAGAKRPG